MSRASAAALLLLLAACSGGDAGNNQSESMGNAGELIGNNMMDAPEQPPLPPAPVAATPTPASTIPAAFVGRWGMVAGDCTSDRGDEKGLMTVAADRLTFHESRAAAQGIQLLSPTKLVVDLAFSGEGQAWRKRNSLTLLDAGRTLVREESDPAGAYTYTRCPA